MISVQLLETLVYYDGVELFVAEDAVRTRYLCLLFEQGQDVDKYIAVALSRERLRQFRLGEVDLLTVLTSRELPTWYTLHSRGDVTIPLPLEAAAAGPIPDSMLPDPGFTLKQVTSADNLVREAVAKGNTLLEIGANPPESAAEHRIRARTLSGLLAVVQSMVTHAYAKSLSHLSPLVRREVSRKNAPILNALLFQPGSFKVVLESADERDLFDQSEIDRGLERISYLLEFSDSAEITIERAKENKGHLAAAYIRLLEFVVDTGTPFTFRWSSPAEQKLVSRSITVTQARPLLEALRATQEIGSEVVILTGKLWMANQAKGSWGIESQDDGKDYTGEVKTGSPNLDGLTISRRYRFECEEMIEEVAGTGREKRTLYLLQHEEIA